MLPRVAARSAALPILALPSVAAAAPWRADLPGAGDGPALALLLLALAAARWIAAEVRAWRLETRLASAQDETRAARAALSGAGAGESLARVTSHLHTVLARALAEATSFDRALSDAVRVLCEEMSWEIGEVWWRDEEFGVLGFATGWHAPSGVLAEQQEVSRQLTWSRGKGLPGRAWAEAKLIEAGADDRQDPWWRRFVELGFEHALVIPIRRAGAVIGVVTLATRRRDTTQWVPHPVLDGLGGQIGDFAEQRRTEETLRMTEARRQAVLESALDCIVTFDQHGRILEFNPAAEQTFGRERASMLGQSIALLVPPQFRERQANAIARSAAGVGDLENRRIAFEGLRSDDSTFPMELSVARIVLGQKTVFTAYARDVTERHELDRLKDELVSTVSHELRTPLASLRGFVELMLVRDFPPEERRRFLTVIDEEVKRLTRLIDDFLDLQRLESGTATSAWTFAMEDTRELVLESVEVVQPTSDTHRFEVDLARDTPHARLDRDRVHQALLNLLTNAVKYSPDGGPVRVRTRLVDECVEISVEDEGMGMSPETIEKIFAKFFRDEAAAARRIGGTGLGLALVKSVAEAHGGTVHAESKPSEGSRFVLRLPIAGPRGQSGRGALPTSP